MQEQRLDQPLKIDILSGSLSLKLKDNFIHIQLNQTQTEALYEENYSNDNLPEIIIMFFQTANDFYLALKKLNREAFKFKDSKLLIQIVVVNKTKTIQLPLRPSQVSKQKRQQIKIIELEHQLTQLKHKNSILTLQVQNMKVALKQKEDNQKQNISMIDYLKEEIEMLQTQLSTLQSSKNQKREIEMCIQNCQEFRQKFKVQRSCINYTNYVFSENKITKSLQNGIYSQIYGQKIQKNRDMRIVLSLSNLTNQEFGIGIQTRNNINLKQLKNQSGVIGYFGKSKIINNNGVVENSESLQLLKSGDLVKIQILIKFRLLTIQVNSTILLTAQIPQSMIQMGLHPFFQLSQAGDSLLLIQ